MKKTAIFSIIVIALLGLGVVAWLWWGTDRSQEELSYDTLWIEVRSGGVFAADISSEENVLQKIETGDTLSVGDIVATDATGDAVVYVPDGSVLRIGSDTRVHIQAFNYDPQSGILDFSAELFAGRVWNKMTGVTTAGSLWRTQTPHIVATTTDAAFGVQAYATSSIAFVSEGGVLVEGNSGARTALSSNMAVRVTEQFVEQNTEEDNEEESFSLQPTTLAELSDGNLGAWVSRERNRDEIIHTMLGELRNVGISDKPELRRELSRYTHGQFTRARHNHIDTQQRMIHFSDELPPELAEIFEDIRQIKETGSIENTPTDKPQSFAPDEAEAIMQELLTDAGISETARAWLFEEYGDQIQNAFAGDLAYHEIRTLTRQYLEVVQDKTIVPPRQLAEEHETNIEHILVTATPELSAPVSEGTTIELTATAVFVDGSTRNITQQAHWTVLGLIGTMQSPGVFNTDLASAQEGVVEASGSIVATFTDESTGANVTGSTPIFRVVAQ